MISFQEQLQIGNKAISFKGVLGSFCTHKLAAGYYDDEVWNKIMRCVVHMETMAFLKEVAAPCFHKCVTNGCNLQLHNI
jgi:hypothetical protein